LNIVKINIFFSLSKKNKTIKSPEKLLERVTMLKDCEEFSQTNSRGRQKTGSGAKKSKRGSVRQQRTCSAELLPRVDEDQKEDAPEKDEAGKMHRQ
jgi:hypothetical protein